VAPAESLLDTPRHRIARRPSLKKDPERFILWAKQCYARQRYAAAIRNLRAYAKKYPDSPEAAEALYVMGLSQMEVKKYYPAFKTFQSIIDKYPLTEHFDELVEKQYVIAELFYARKSYEYSEKVFSRVVLNAPFSKIADSAQYRLALSLMNLRRFAEARTEFEKIPENYSFSPLLDSAVFHAALCSFKLSAMINDYDEALLDKGIADLKIFLARYETSAFAPQAAAMLEKLVDKKAERMYRVGAFYEKQKKHAAALMYYRITVREYGRTAWAEKARQRADRLQARINVTN
ncbi:MAG: outer membrane protein assembly factor BamD, partial [Candidatus Omnitrophica bacterium]|nr:outer membrane protein assembly factor BamD [Candidatus Omnitrophota bacterium]